MLMPTLRVEFVDGRKVFVRGRTAWSLKKLTTAGAAGCSVFDNLAPRWSGYVYKLRKLGFVIDTIRERHRGRFPGHHARYILRSQVSILEAVGC
jgi:hypothetical protein